MNAKALTSVLFTAVALQGCGVSLIHDPKAPATSGEFVGGTGPADYRKLTALVRTKAPERLRLTYEALAAKMPSEEQADSIRGMGAGGSGSGALVVHNENGTAIPYVVTNRHVVEEAQRVDVSFSDGTSYADCEVIYENEKDDVAVIALPEGAQRMFAYGFGVASGEVKERQTVVAAGYPGINGEPSFQTTEGKISNARFTAFQGPDEKPLYQHSAAIDPGSSGGPLTNEAGELVGLNVALVRSRQALNLSVPVSAVVESVRAAGQIREGRASQEWLLKSLEQACNTFIGEIGSTEARTKEITNYVSVDLVAREGFPSMAALAKVEPNVLQTFREQPFRTLRASVGGFFTITAKTKGIASTSSCTPINRADLPSLVTSRSARMGLPTANGVAETRWIFEHGNWRLSGGPLGSMRDELAEAQAAIDANAAQGRKAATGAGARNTAPVRKSPAAPTDGSSTPPSAPFTTATAAPPPAPTGVPVRLVPKKQ